MKLLRVALVALWTLPLTSSAAVAAFSVKTADDVVLTDVQLKGHAFVVWYEAPDTIHLNDAAKADLDRFRETIEEPRRTLLVAAGDVSGYDFWPARGLAKGELRAAEKFYGRPIYGDWTGSMRAAFGFIKGQSNLQFIDADGVVRFRGVGKIEATDVERVKKLMLE